MLPGEVIITFLSLLIVFIGALLWQKKSKTAMKLIAIILAPVTIFEYFVLFWYWAGDGTFNFFAVPILFLFYFLLHNILIKKYKQLKVQSTILKFSLFAFLPLLTIGTVWLVSRILGININIQ